MSEFITLARASDIPCGRGVTIHALGREIALFNLDGTFHALDGCCPHRGGPLGDGLTDQGRVFCPLHGWEFDIKTGACADRPDKPAACFPTRVVNGEVQVCL